MARTKYDDALGVCRLQWKLGPPSEDDERPVLCEVWRPEAIINHAEAMKPQVRVVATIEMRVYSNGWKHLRYGGALDAATPGDVRRHAHMTSRWWSQTITLDGWS